MAAPINNPRYGLAPDGALQDDVGSLGDFFRDCASWFRANPDREYRFCIVSLAVYDLLYEMALAPSRYVAEGNVPSTQVRISVAVQRAGYFNPDRRRLARGPHTSLPHVVPVLTAPAGVSLVDTDEVGRWLMDLALRDEHAFSGW